MLSIKKHLNVLILSVSGLLAVLILSNAFLNSNKVNDSIIVDGSSTANFKADFVVWSGSFSRKSTNFKYAFYQIKKDRQNVRKYLLAKGLLPDEIHFHSVNFNSKLRNKDEASFDGYLISQTVEISSKNISQIEDIANNITDLIDFDIVFYSNSPAYYYSKIANLKLKLIEEATNNARLRAEKIAEGAKTSLGKLKYAKMGDFKILGDDTEDKNQSNYNFTSKEKTISLSMRFKYSVN